MGSVLLNGLVCGCLARSELHIKLMQFQTVNTHGIVALEEANLSSCDRIMFVCICVFNSKDDFLVYCMNSGSSSPFLSPSADISDTWITSAGWPPLRLYFK